MNLRRLFTLVATYSACIAGAAHAGGVIRFAHTQIGGWRAKCESTYLSHENVSERYGPLLTGIDCDAQLGPIGFHQNLMDRQGTSIGLDIENNTHRIYNAISFDGIVYPLRRVSDAREDFAQLRFFDVEPRNDHPCSQQFEPNCQGAYLNSGISILAIEAAPGFWLKASEIIILMIRAKDVGLRFKQLENPVSEPKAGMPVHGEWTQHWDHYDIRGLDRVAEWSERVMASPQSRVFNRTSQPEN